MSGTLGTKTICGKTINKLTIITKNCKTSILNEISNKCSCAKFSSHSFLSSSSLLPFPHNFFIFLMAKPSQSDRYSLVITVSFCNCFS